MSAPFGLFLSLGSPLFGPVFAQLSLSAQRGQYWWQRFLPSSSEVPGARCSRYAPHERQGNRGLEELLCDTAISPLCDSGRWLKRE